VVRLRDGSVLRGEIVKNSVDKMLTVRILDSTDISVKYVDLVLVKSKGFKYRSGFPNNRRGYFNQSFIGLTLQRSGGDDPITGLPSFHSVNGYLFSRFLKVGIGVAYDGYPDINTVPIYANIAGDILESKITPIYSFGIGYGIAGTRNDEFRQIQEASGGLFYTIGTGILINGISSSFIIGLDYKHQAVDLEFSDWWWGGTLTEKRKFRNLAVKIGFQF